MATRQKSEPDLPKYYFEDLPPGTKFHYGPRKVTAEEIVAFAAEFDPQPMHLGPVAEGQSMLGEFIASGWQTCSLMMRMAADGFILDSAAMGAGGVESVRWPSPLRPGDFVSLDVEILDARPSRSRPEMGIVRQRWRLVTQAGDVVGEMTSPLMIGRRPADSSVSRP
jgi:acyl dehydratase